jgi:hypothetical protein
MSESWRLTIVAPARWLSANDQANWYAKVGPIRQWREAAYWAAVQAKLPKGLGRVHITATLHFTDRRRRDADNLHPTLKPIIDGLGPQRVRVVRGMPRVALGYGLIPDDTPEHLTTTLTIGEPLPRKPMFRGTVELHIEDRSDHRQQ